MFLLAFVQAGTIKEACDLVGIWPQTVNMWRDKDEEFAEAFARADAEALELALARQTVRPAFVGRRVGAAR